MLRMAPALATAGIAAWLAASVPVSSSQGAREISGSVRDDRGPVPGATIRIQTTTTHTTTDVNGRFVLEGVPRGQPIALMAWAPGYYNAGPVSAASGDADILIRMTPHTAADNPSYQWMGARLAGGKNCEQCHSEPGRAGSLLPFDEWVGDAHGTSAVNPRFLSMYNGTDAGGQHRSPPTRYTSHADYGRFPLPPDPAQPDYGPGYRLDAPNTAGTCAACHAPAAASDAPYSTDPNALSGVGREGVACDVCHKVWRVKIDRTTGLPAPNMPGVLSMEFRRPPAGHQLFIGPLDDVAGDDTYSPLLQRSEFCAPCHAASFWGVSVYNSFGEWQRSQYNDPVAGRTCQDCHMPRRGATHFVRPDKGGHERAPETIFSHRMPGAADVDLLRSALRLDATAERHQGRVTVEIRVRNENAGHDVPTDHPARNVLLVVGAIDANGRPLRFEGTQVIPAWGGEGSDADDYAGRPGKGYAKVLEERWTGVAPTAAYWRPTIVRDDTRIPAGAVDVTRYEFVSPVGAGEVTIDAKVVFRRAFKALAVRKGWQTPDVVMATARVVVRN